MLQFCDGNRNAFEELMEIFYPSILNFCYRFLGQRAAAEDLTQEVFLRIHDQANKYKPGSSFKTWIFVIARNQCLNYLRQNKRTWASVAFDPDEYSSNTDKPDEIYLQQEMEVLVKQALSRLPERQKTALILNKYEDLSYLEIAQTMKLTEKAVKSLLARARETLKDLLSPLIENKK